MRALHSLRIARVVPALGTAATALLTAALAACADSPTAPAAPRAAAAPARAVSGNDTSYTTFKTNPKGTDTFVIGGVHKVQLVAGSICDPATSGYGPALWDASCLPATQSITITAKAWTRPDGHPMVSFSPDLRFVPGKVNTIWLMDKAAVAAGTGTIAWCPSGGGACVDEGAADPSVATQRDLKNGFEYRRIKHFSGFTVVSY